MLEVSPSEMSGGRGPLSSKPPNFITYSHRDILIFQVCRWNLKEIGRNSRIVLPRLKTFDGVECFVGIVLPV